MNASRKILERAADLLLKRTELATKYQASIERNKRISDLKEAITKKYKSLMESSASSRRLIEMVERDISKVKSLSAKATPDGVDQLDLDELCIKYGVK